MKNFRKTKKNRQCKYSAVGLETRLAFVYDGETFLDDGEEIVNEDVSPKDSYDESIVAGAGRVRLSYPSACCDNDLDSENQKTFLKDKFNTIISYGILQNPYKWVEKLKNVVWNDILPRIYPEFSTNRNKDFIAEYKDDADFKIWKEKCGTPEHAEARQALLRSHESGNPLASFELGSATVQTNSQGRLDFSDTYPYYHCAAQKNDPRAQMMVGIMHYEGRWAEKDLAAAYAWIFLSARAGWSKAAYFMRDKRQEVIFYFNLQS